jgi:hypothetical protein
MRLDDGKQMPFGVPWSNSPPGYFSTRPAVVSGLSKAVSWSRFGLERSSFMTRTIRTHRTGGPLARSEVKDRVKIE